MNRVIREPSILLITGIHSRHFQGTNLSSVAELANFFSYAARWSTKIQSECAKCKKEPLVLHQRQVLNSFRSENFWRDTICSYKPSHGTHNGRTDRHMMGLLNGPFWNGKAALTEVIKQFLTQVLTQTCSLCGDASLLCDGSDAIIVSARFCVGLHGVNSTL